MQAANLRRLIAACTLIVTASAPAADLTVSAASSLSNAFREIAVRYESTYPGATLALNFGASGALLQQIAKGAPADVFASADQETMDMAEKQGLVKAAERHDFASNVLVVVVPNGAAVEPKRLADLAQAGVKRVAIGAPASVPAGRYARQALESAGQWPQCENKAIYTQNVRQSLDYVARGEVDAGFVYATDAARMKDKVKVAFTVALDTPIRYPIAPVAASAKADEARRFVDFVRSPRGQAILAQYGFGKP